VDEGHRRATTSLETDGRVRIRRTDSETDGRVRIRRTDSETDGRVRIRRTDTETDGHVRVRRTDTETDGHVRIRRTDPETGGNVVPGGRERSETTTYYNLVDLCRIMADSVLVPIDGSEESMNALEYAVGEYPDASVTVLYVIEPGSIHDVQLAVDAVPRGDPPEAPFEDAQGILAEAAELAPDAETATASGPVARTIVAYADREGMDLIVVGSRGRDGAARTLLGSVAETVARRAPCPVLIAR